MDKPIQSKGSSFGWPERLAIIALVAFVMALALGSYLAAIAFMICAVMGHPFFS